MSTRAILSMSVGARLHVWTPVRPGAHLRVIYVEDTLHTEIMAGTDFRIGALWQDFDRFSLGGLITVGYGVESTCMMKLLDPPDAEIWEMRSRDPEPQIRVFGRFCDQDVFVATNIAYRDHLGDPRWSKFDGNHWPEEILRCRQIWDQLCQGSPPHSGGQINDYISQNAVEVGKFS